MVNRRRLPWVDIALIIMLVVGAVIVFSQSQADTNAKQEKTRLETRIRVAEITLSQMEQETNLESLRQNLEQAQLALAEIHFPSEIDAIAVTDNIIQHANEYNITISRWNTSYTSATLKEKNYSAISHSLRAEGEAYALTRFVEALTKESAAPVIQNMNISEVTESENIWQIELELLVYYH